MRDYDFQQVYGERSHLGDRCHFFTGPQMLNAAVLMFLSYIWSRVRPPLNFEARALCLSVSKMASQYPEAVLQSIYSTSMEVIGFKCQTPNITFNSLQAMLLFE